MFSPLTFSSTSSIWEGKTFTPRMIIISSERPMGLLIRTWVRPQGQGERSSTQMSRVR